MIVSTPFPITLKGITFPVKKTPRFNTLASVPISGRGRVAIPLMQYPTFDFEISFNYLKGSETAGGDYVTLLDFYQKCLGSAASFPYLDQFDNFATFAPIGTGDGVSTVFQMFQKWNGASQKFPVFFLNSSGGYPQIYDNGTLVSSSNYSITNGAITFTSAPASGHTLTWSGAFYYAVHFASDTLDQLDLMMQGIWELASLKLEGDLL